MRDSEKTARSRSVDSARYRAATVREPVSTQPVRTTFWSARKVPVFGRPQAANRMLLHVASHCTASVTAGRELA